MTVYQKTAATAIVCLALGLGAAACKKNPAVAQSPPPPEPTAPAKPPAPPAPPTAPTAAPTPRALTDEEIMAQKSLDQLNKERPLGDVFFDLDQSSIRDEARASLSTNADWLKRWTGTRITIEGHCDERGTAEYNLGLGERRANAVKSYLVQLGVPGDRIVVVSKGKESPFCTESNEACWQQNRRGHFIITAK
jgi:peptidoglycan-associated lipoprotein